LSGNAIQRRQAPSAHRQAARLSFVERVEAAAEQVEDLDSARLVIGFQAGDRDAFAALYRRYFDRVYGYLKLVLRDHHEAEDATQQVFIKALEALPRYERRKQPFRAWLFIVVRNYAVQLLRRDNALVLESEELNNRVDRAAPTADAQLRALSFVTDQDFMVLIGRLPLPQRQVLALRYMLDLPHAEIATILDREPGAVRAIHHRALKALETRLTRLGRAPRHDERSARMRRWVKRAPVLRERRFALLK
jgi:RNA polymerase sigma-70 factor (ECF subfamily)